MQIKIEIINGKKRVIIARRDSSEDKLQTKSYSTYTYYKEVK